MGTLLRKEFRALVPIIVLVVVLAVMDDLLVLCTEFPDQKPLSTFLDPKEELPVLALGTATISLILAFGLLVRESDEGTLAFLDALPVTRTRVFSAKVFATLVIMTFSVMIEFGGAAIFDLLSRNSLSAPFPWRVFATGFAVNWVVGFAVIGFVLALSFLRRWLFLVLGILAWAYLLLDQWRLPNLAWLNPFRLAHPTIEGGRWLVSPAHLAVQLAIGFGGLMLAFAGFQLTGDRSRRLVEKFRQNRAAGVFAALGLIAIPAVWLGFFLQLAAESQTGHSPARPADLVTHRESAHYAFIFRQGQSADLEKLLAASDAIHTRVASFFGVTGLAEPITVDMTSEIARHNAGQAFWKKIRMDLASGEEANENVAVLAHETAHVYLDQLSEYRLASAFPSTRFFHEGVASYLEHHFFRSPEELAQLRRTAAIAHAWMPVQFADLAKDLEWSRQRDRNLVYPLGELFCAALVQTCGDAAPATVARAFARRGAPKDLTGATLWQDTLQAAGYSLERVLAAWHRELEGLVVAERLFIESIPRLRATVTATPGEIMIAPVFSGKEPGKLVCVTRPRDDAAEYEHDDWVPGRDGVIRIPRRQFAGPAFWYQLGWRVEAAALPIYEPWIEAPLR